MIKYTSAGSMDPTRAAYHISREDLIFPPNHEEIGRVEILSTTRVASQRTKNQTIQLYWHEKGWNVTIGRQGNRTMYRVEIKDS